MTQLAQPRLHQTAHLPYSKTQTPHILSNVAFPPQPSNPHSTRSHIPGKQVAPPHHTTKPATSKHRTLPPARYEANPRHLPHAHGPTRHTSSMPFACSKSMVVVRALGQRRRSRCAPRYPTRVMDVSARWHSGTRGRGRVCRAG